MLKKIRIVLACLVFAGIIALFAYNYLVAKVDSVVNEMEAKSLTFMDIVSEGE